jgi:c-di-GMP-binding flagellar brake protein YcgR
MSSHRPETDPGLLERYGVPDRAERSRLLAELVAGSERVRLHAADDHGCFVESRLLSIDAADGSLELELELEMGDIRREAFVRAGRVTATALIASVKLQFELEPFVLRELAGERSRLHAPLPVVLVRLQRREAFRVAPATESTARLWVRDPGGPDGERRIPVTDVSATGLGLRMQRSDSDAPVVGTVFDRVRLELPGTSPIHCDLVVRAIGADLSGERGALRVGCEFRGLDSAAARAVQVFVNTAQTRGRRLRPARA